MVYFPTWSGEFVAVNYLSCSIHWRINVTQLVYDYAPITGPTAITKHVSRSSPQIDGDILFFGTITHALVIAVNRYNGKILGQIQVNQHPLALLTMSPTFYDNKLFIGSSSLEETGADHILDYPCCSFVGNMVALSFDKSNGHFHVEWNVTMLPLQSSWSGAAIWGSQPAVDPVRKQIFIATGNVYSFPKEYEKCENQTASCLPLDVWQESVLALDIESGKVNWIQRLAPLDAWTVSCGGALLPPVNPQNCPPEPGTDADFGMAPTFVPRGTHNQDTIVVGQKNGVLYSMSAETGKIFWSTMTSPGGAGGGLSWGVAVDNERVYFTAINSASKTWRSPSSGQTISNSAYGAISLHSGVILWETPAPKSAVAYGPPTAVGDLILVARTGDNIADYENTAGGLVALSQNDGSIVADFDLPTNFHGGIAVASKYLAFGTGYDLGYSGTGSLYIMRIT
ncbi:quinon protein alcohol dehydrogenase-like superfamily [Xylogone sp. PMI_703]|nr:quinon protein alcohol dehydrogenase-like superfamily [Xylogone sp. PMI_703]